MTITEKYYNFSSPLEKRKNTDFIILHHAAAKVCSADDIHRIHQSNGWSGIGYHYFVRKDGTVFSGRPVGKIGAHCIGKNSESVGVCFEGNFEKEEMPVTQFEAGKELIAYLKGIYKDAKVKKHSDFNATVCPGKNFPFNKISSPVYEDESDIISILSKRGIMTDIPLWKEKCKGKTNAYYLAKNIANKTTDTKLREKPLESVNDIVWELCERKIITDKNLWLSLFEKDKNLYWLGFKAVNQTK